MKRPRIRAGGFYFSRGYAAPAPGSTKLPCYAGKQIIEYFTRYMANWSWMRQTFSGLKLSLEKIVINLHHDEIMRYKAKKLYFYHTSSRLANNDLFLTTYSFVLQMNLCRNSTSLTSTSTKIFIDILLSVKRGLEKFRPHFPSKLKMSTKIFTDILLPD